ncbi:MAG: hypothetical protein V3R82_05925 [Candidatus Hydrothermarchaeales archaeon]
MVRCEDCTLLEIYNRDNEKFWNQCVLYDTWDLDLVEDRVCEDFQPKP